MIKYYRLLMKYSKKNKKNKKILIILSISILVLNLIILVSQRLESNGDSIKKETPSVIVDKEKDDLNIQNLPDTINNQNIVITVSTVGQDADAGDLIFRTILSSNSDGICSFKLSRNGVEKNFSSSIEFSGTYYSCNYNVPYQNLSSGNWDYQITVTSGKSSGLIRGEVNLNG